MSGIKLVKRIKYAGDVHSALMELGWDAKTAAAFLDDIPDADAEKVCEQMGLVKEAMDMAKAYLRPVRHGRWIISSDGYYPYCWDCKARPKGGNMTKYCPNCGAKMKGADDE